MKSRLLLSVLSVLVMSSAIGADKAPVPAKDLLGDLLKEINQRPVKRESKSLPDKIMAFSKNKSESQLKEIVEWVIPIIKAGNPENFELERFVFDLVSLYPAVRQVLLEAYLTGKNERAYLYLPSLMQDVPESITGNLLKQAHGNLLKEAIEEGMRYGFGNSNREYKSMVSLLAKYRLEETVEAIIKTYPKWGQESLLFIVKRNPRAALPLLREVIVASEIIDTSYAFETLFTYNKPDVVANVVCANLPSIKNNYKSIGLAVKAFLPKETRHKINMCIIENFHKVNPKIWNLLDVDLLTPEQKKILADLEKKQWHDTGYGDIFGVHSLSTPTAGHLNRITRQGMAGEFEQDRGPLGTLLFHEDMNGYRDSELFQGLVKKVHDIQEQGYKKGYYTYIHAHTWPLDFDQRVYAELHPERLGKDFFPLHFLTLTKKEAFPVQINGATISEGKCIKILLDEGAVPSVYGERYLLSMNTSFLGNLARLGESTAAYLATSRSIRPPKAILEAVFEDDGTNDIYNKYKAQFDSLAALHLSCSKFGKLWIIMVPKELNKQLVIPAMPFGHKTPVNINGKETYDVDVIQEALYKGGQSVEDIDTIQFRLLMTPKTGLNPNLGIETIPISLADPKCYAEFNVQFKKLMVQVKADIAAKQKAMPRAKL